MFQSQTVAQAKDYFRDALSKADYYMEDQEMNGVFNGKVAKRLGIEGDMIDKETFEKLCDNINPKDGGSLTPYTLENRRVGYDISFHCPKSVSIAYGLSNDEDMLRCFEESVDETMREIEVDAQTRIRKDGQYDDRDTGELLWTNFVHKTARPTEGFAPDPHLHCHCFTFNATFDHIENKFKAAQFHNIKRDMPYYQARFQKRLADKLSELGYHIRKTNNGFEMAVIPQKVIDHFSKRTNLIGQVAKEKGITNRKELDQLGARTRGAKNKNMTMPDLIRQWRKQIDENGLDTLDRELRTTDYTLDAEKSVEYALDHVFTRNSVKRDRQIVAEGYKYVVDNNQVTLDDIDAAFLKNDRVFRIQVGSQQLCTTQLVHAEERRMINLARDGIGKLRPLKPNYKSTHFSKLNEEQKLVLKHVMTSQDKLTMIRGAAGTGKTTLLKTAVPEIEKTGREVFLFAPTAEAARDVLRKEGFEKADTVARFLKDKDLQQKIQGQVVWVDEAGMLGAKDMSKLLEITGNHSARLILSGDPRQHSAVDRGDAMRLLQSVGKVPIVSMERIYRQKSDQYKQAVKEISSGNIAQGFERLDKQDCIKEQKPERIKKDLVDEYISTIKNKKSALVISPTRSQVRTLNEDIRQALRQHKKIGKREKSFTVLDNLHFTDAQKKDTRMYKEGMIIQPHKNLPSNNGGIVKGSKLSVVEVQKDIIIVKDKHQKQHRLPTQKAHGYAVFVPREILLSKGDTIRIVNKNGFDLNKKRLDNRTELKIDGFTKEGDIKAVKISKSSKSQFVLPKDHGNFDYAYATTSYSAQGKTVDHVIVEQNSTTFAASNQKQFYVSVSRARENVTVYTDDKEELLKTIEKLGDRQGATELIHDDYFRTKTIDIETPSQNKEITPTPNKDSYEPEL
jgi:conjugative relaxase-like TrwC/TraI family protein